MPPELLDAAPLPDEHGMGDPHEEPGPDDPGDGVNRGLEPVYFQVMHGRAKPETMGYADESLFANRDAHLKVAPTGPAKVPG